MTAWEFLGVLGVLWSSWDLFALPGGVGMRVVIPHSVVSSCSAKSMKPWWNHPFESPFWRSETPKSSNDLNCLLLLVHFRNLAVTRFLSR